MKTENISNSQFKSLIIMFILGTSLLISGDSQAMEDTWISLLIAMLIAIPLVFIYCKLILLFPGTTLFDILLKVYGKLLGKLFIIFYTLYFFHLGAIDIRNTTEYIQVVSFPETPQYVTAIFIGILSIYAINLGLSILSTWTKLTLPIIIAMIFTTFILAIPKFNISYIKPILYNGWKPVINSAYSLLTFPFAETVIFIVFFGYLNNKKDTTKIYISSILIGGFLLLIAALRNILLLGFPNLSKIYFPSHYATSLINIHGFIQRIEIIISINLILASFTKVAVCLYASSIGVSKIFNFRNFKKTSILLCILMIILSLLLYKSTMGMFEFINIYKYYVIPFQFVIPILTFIIAKIRRKSIQGIE
ncbi:endospore germination permease [Tissierella sp.]|uniref:GerAB/ArcD/ProY family transporter n=1 Tax=Tissierella sp. TaxID=41274 RepID=UPI0028A8E28B|nr:endospore germination permease [Tissierella sp.]